MGDDRLLAGLRVLDLTGPSVARAGRILADLGATVVQVRRQTDAAAGRPASGAPPSTVDPWAVSFWSVGRAGVVDEDDPTVAELAASADVVVAAPADPAAARLTPGAAPDAVWVDVTPFGTTGPRAGWRASDLGVHAATGNLFCTGDPDRPPVRCTQPVAEAHAGPEVVVAALTALASGRPRRVDVSMQEAVLIANLGGVGRYAREQQPGRRRGADIGRTREIWPCADGWVSFGIRGGRARVGTWTTVVELARADGVDVSAVQGWDWATFDHTTASDDDLAALSGIVEAFCAARTTRQLYALACEHNLTLAPVNGPAELVADEQLAARAFFRPDAPGIPGTFVVATDPADGHRLVAPGPAGTDPTTGDGHDDAPDRTRHTDRTSGTSTAAPDLIDGTGVGWPTGSRFDWRRRDAELPAGASPGAWAGTTIIELGTGAAGPIATRYFAEHGALVIRIESRSRPDFLRAYARDLDASGMFDALNPNKRSVAIDLKHPEGRDLALALIDRADAVAENFAPRALRRLGLDEDTLFSRRPDLVLASACLNGQTGPFRDYPGFGSQGAALSGYTFLTGWPDRAPVGPFGTITDSLAPRLSAAALAAALLHRRRTGRGVRLDLSQVEAAVWSLGPWLTRFADGAGVEHRNGNRHAVAVPHGVFPCAGDDRWVAVAVWSDDEWRRLAETIGADHPRWHTADGRRADVAEVEAAVASWTRLHPAADVADALQAIGLEAVPVADLADCFTDPQLAHRGHLVELTHAVLGPGCYERNGFRLVPDTGGYDRPSPLLGEDSEWVLGELLGLGPDERARLRDIGAVEPRIGPQR